MSEQFESILSEVELFGRSLRNRLAVAPMSRVSSSQRNDGVRENGEYAKSTGSGLYNCINTDLQNRLFGILLAGAQPDA